MNILTKLETGFSKTARAQVHYFYKMLRTSDAILALIRIKSTQTGQFVDKLGQAKKL